MTDGADTSGTEQLPECDWCDNTIHRLNGNVDKKLCATCLGKAKCGWAPDKDDWRDHSVDTATQREEVSSDGC